MITVTDHAKRRFAIRIDATVDPERSIKKMWQNGTPATEADMSFFRAVFQRDTVYRVCEYAGRGRLLLACRNNSIVTIIDNDLSPRAYRAIRHSKR